MSDTQTDPVEMEVEFDEYGLFLTLTFKGPAWCQFYVEFSREQARALAKQLQDYFEGRICR